MKIEDVDRAQTLLRSCSELRAALADLSKVTGYRLIVNIWERDEMWGPRIDERRDVEEVALVLSRIWTRSIEKIEAELRKLGVEI